MLQLYIALDSFARNPKTHRQSQQFDSVYQNPHDACIVS